MTIKAQPRIISVDGGVSYLKIYDGDKLHTIPSVIEKAAPHHAESIRVNEETWLVGEHAILSSTRLDFAPRSDGRWHGHEDQYTQICYGLTQLGAQGSYDALIFALPYSDKNDAQLCDAIKQRYAHFTWQVRDKGRTGWRDMEVTFDSVRITAQGTGAWLHESATRDQAPDTICVADLGAETLDVFVLRRDSSGRHQYSCGASLRGKRVSVSDFFATWTQSLSNRRELQRRALGYYDLMMRATKRDWSVLVDGQPVSIKNEYNDACDYYGTGVLEALRETCGQLWDNVGRIVLTGGGAHLAGPFIQKRDSRVIITDSAANVKGQHLALAMQYAQQPAASSHDDENKESKKTHGGKNHLAAANAFGAAS